MSERTDRKQAIELAKIYLPMTRCAGGNLTHQLYCCPWCDSVDPGNECYKPRPGYGKKSKAGQ